MEERKRHNFDFQREEFDIGAIISIDLKSFFIMFGPFSYLFYWGVK